MLAVSAVLLALSQQALAAAHRQAARQQARAELSVLALALEAYRREQGAYPAANTGAELWARLRGGDGPAGGRAWVDPAAHRLRYPDPAAPGNDLRDPWDGAYEYRRLGLSPEAGYVLFSAGPDGRAQGPDGAGRFPLHPDNRDNLYAGE